MPKDASEEIIPPQQVSLDPEMRKIVLAGVKFLLARLKQSGLMEPQIEYRDVLLTPALMEIFIIGVKENMDIGKDLFVDESGNPVFDLTTKLVCGATLGELERLLVYTCASKIFVASKKPKKAEEKKKKGLGLFGGKKDKSKEKKEKKDEDKISLLVGMKSFVNGTAKVGCMPAKGLTAEFIAKIGMDKAAFSLAKFVDSFGKISW